MVSPLAHLADEFPADVTRCPESRSLDTFGLE
jgi:hypothetical protein